MTKRQTTSMRNFIKKEIRTHILPLKSLRMRAVERCPVALTDDEEEHVERFIEKELEIYGACI